MTKQHLHELMVVGGFGGAIVLIVLLWGGHGAAKASPSAPYEPFPTANPPIGPGANVAPVGSPQLNGPDVGNGAPATQLQTIGIPSVQTPNFSSGDCGCQCGGSCPSNPNQIPSITQMQAIGKANENAIYAQGDATLRTLAAMGSNGWLNVNVEPSETDTIQAQ